jgi:hypothetical protein
MVPRPGSSLKLQTADLFHILLRLFHFGHGPTDATEWTIFASFLLVAVLVLFNRVPNILPREFQFVGTTSFTCGHYAYFFDPRKLPRLSFGAFLGCQHPRPWVVLKLLA